MGRSSSARSDLDDFFCCVTSKEDPNIKLTIGFNQSFLGLCLGVYLAEHFHCGCRTCALLRLPCLQLTKACYCIRVYRVCEVEEIHRGPLRANSTTIKSTLNPQWKTIVRALVPKPTGEAKFSIRKISWPAGGDGTMW